MAGIGHLTRRFFGSLSPFGPSDDDVTWAHEHLLDAESELWDQMSRQDRRHSAGVARAVAGELGVDCPREVIAAALLHDVGKLDSGLGTYGRVVATVCGAVADRDTAYDWSRSRGITRRIGLYLRHAEIGAGRLELAGSDPLTVAWAREHHMPADECTIDPAYAEVLRSCDDD